MKQENLGRKAQESPGFSRGEEVKSCDWTRNRLSSESVHVRCGSGTCDIRAASLTLLRREAEETDR